MTDKSIIQQVLNNYELEGTLEDTSAYGYGRINKTILITTKNPNEHKYILQRINTTLFGDVDALMQNISAVTSHLRNKIINRGGNPTRETLSIVKTKDGKNYVEHEGECYRIYEYIENSICFQTIDDPKQLFEVGKAFGTFQKDLLDFDAKALSITLPDFHNTQKRYADFENILALNPCKRNHIAPEVLNKIIKRKTYSGLFAHLIHTGALPQRVTHNDTKLNNVIFDANTKHALAILDLDTVMPDTLLSDFGDAIRSSCNPAGEEATDLSTVKFDKDAYAYYCEGYLSQMQDYITTVEMKYLPYAPLVITYELALRFFTDFLNGDKYFGVSSQFDNLNRAKVQLTLLLDMEKNFEYMKKIVYAHDRTNDDDSKETQPQFEQLTTNKSK